MWWHRAGRAENLRSDEVSEETYVPSLWKGLLAGAIAGIAATAAKSMVEKFYPPRVHGEPEPPEVLAAKVAGHPLDEHTGAAASEAIHWGFGAAAGAVYGALAEFYPAATAKEGASFAMALVALTHETALPALGLAERAEDQTLREQTSEMSSHVLYGIVTERVRRILRNYMG
jgi:putative membrane protein